MTVAIKFDSDQNYQIEAIDSVVGLFNGVSKYNEQDTDFGEKIIKTTEQQLFGEFLFVNKLSITRDRLIDNLREVQSRIRKDAQGFDSLVIPEELQKPIMPGEWPSDFSIEMETGTGKTYVYIRTAIELYLKYGLTKFVIVVPSVAIREGVLSTLRLTKEHFKEVFDGIQYDYNVYESKGFNKIRQFAASSHLQILVMNIASFNRDENIIKKEMDDLNGLAPIEYIQSVNPVVIMDEPQKLSSELSSKSIESLNPLFKLRYSATHKDPHHLIYRLTPIDAYNLKLVKKIDVLSMTSDDNLNNAFIEVKNISGSKSSVTATLIVNKGKSKTQITARRGMDLYEYTKMQIYKGWIVEDIHTESDDSPGKIEFLNGQILRVGSNTGIDSELWQRAQIRATIEEHFETELKLEKHFRMGAIYRTKPLSLFFIDKVANYFPSDGKFRTWFIEEYKNISSKKQYQQLNMPSAETAHSGYFAVSKLGPKDSNETRSNKEDEDAFDLIMRDKERLLSHDEPVRFIFSHSALAEGWDNPNVFTICNLQEVNSEVKKRQQIGRGLRLPVMENGERCRVDELNHLTIIATESFENYASLLQKELEDEMGIDFSGFIKNKRTRKRLKPKEGFTLLPGFRDLWVHIAVRTQYKLEFDSQALVSEAIRRLNNFEGILQPSINFSKHKVSSISQEHGLVAAKSQIKASKNYKVSVFNFDILNDLTQELPVSRDTIAQVIMESGRYAEASINPAVFIGQVRDSIVSALATILKDNDGIKYSKVSDSKDSIWDMNFFEENEIEGYEDNLVNVNKSIYDQISVDSFIERRFAEDLDAREDVDLFLKLPKWFKVDTPIGGYNPDWAIVRRDSSGLPRLYLVRETKGTTNLDELFRESEVWKVTFGRKHFEAINVDYKVIKNAKELDNDSIAVIK
jgi:type III restriction enzyme